MKVVSKSFGKYLIFVTCFAYSVAYLGRLSFAANITAIRTEFGYSKDYIGLVSSFLFFSYGAGQLFNVVMAKRYNPKFVFAISMGISALCNLAIPFASASIPLMCGIWLINGICQSMLWCNVLNVQAKYLSAKQIPLCILFLGFSYCIGTFVIYALSSVFIETWRITFYIVSAISLFTAVLWFITVDRAEKVEKTEEEMEKLLVPAEPEQKKVKVFTAYFCFVLAFALLIAVFNSYIRDGVVTWLPSILKDEFGFSDKYSTLIVCLCALLSTLGITLVKFLADKIKGHMFLQGIMLIIIAGLSALGIYFYTIRLLIPFIITFVVIVCLIYGVANIVTSQIPFGIRKYGNVGGFSALLDAFCYVGSSLATYTFGAIAEGSGWLAVLIVIASVACFGSVLGFVGTLFAKKTPMTKELL